MEGDGWRNMKFNKKELKVIQRTKDGVYLFGKIGGNLFELIVSIISSIFWLYLTFGFIRFAIMSVFGLYGAMNGDYALALETIKEHENVWNTMAWGIALIFIIINVKFNILYLNKQKNPHRRKRND